MNKNDFASRENLIVKGSADDENIDAEAVAESVRRSSVSNQVSASSEVHGDIISGRR